MLHNKRVEPSKGGFFFAPGCSSAFFVTTAELQILQEKYMCLPVAKQDDENMLEVELKSRKEVKVWEGLNQNIPNIKL
ncbi:hypothetical protein EBO34_16370 [Alteribacter keqinensis]|uniref:Uncharacterized protein n=1 Tax=Alteribacter keqinensis TaxID=2483800 RepID=A0A3M7TMC5_9BACI|nr:hypothetical protein EBO34_16370 [Alteribacter keqinensis]